MYIECPDIVNEKCYFKLMLKVHIHCLLTISILLVPSSNIYSGIPPFYTWYVLVVFGL